MAQVSRNFVSRTGNPTIIRKSNSIIVRHREYCSDIAVNVGVLYPAEGFSNIIGDITPINPQFFPWLSQLAPQFETYRFNRLSFQYEPYCATSTSGTLIIGIDYDPSDTAPESKTDIMSYEESVRSNVWAPVTHHCLSKNLHKMKEYWMQGVFDPYGGSGTLRTEHVGRVNIVCMNGSASLNVGEIYVDYEVELITPQLNPNVTASFYSLSSSTTNIFSLTVPGNPLVRYNRIRGRFINTNTFGFTSNLDRGVIFLKQLGTGVTLAPSIAAVAGSGFVVTGELVSAVNTGATEGLYIASFKAPPGSSFLVITAVATTITGWVMDIIPQNQLSFYWWGATFNS